MSEQRSVAGDNKLELLLFKLGKDSRGGESAFFGINVFKVREIVAMPPITPVAGAAPHLLGVVNIRGEIISVIDLPSLAGCKPETGLNIMLVTEFARTTQAFAVESVDEIVQLEWSQVLAAENTAAGSIVSSIARLDGNVDHSRLVQVLDVETVLRDANPTAEEAPLAVGDPISIRKGQVVLVADDSALARALIEQSLTALSLPYVTVKTGEEAWERLQAMAQAAEANGQNISDSIALVLTDLEMPVMDGYTLTRNIKQSPRFQKLPVLIHSSLSGPANGSRAAEVGADGYIAKFAAAELASEIRKILKS